MLPNKFLIQVKILLFHKKKCITHLQLKPWEESSTYLILAGQMNHFLYFLLLTHCFQVINSSTFLLAREKKICSPWSQNKKKKKKKFPLDKSILALLGALRRFQSIYWRCSDSHFVKQRKPYYVETYTSECSAVQRVGSNCSIWPAMSY